MESTHENRQPAPTTNLLDTVETPFKNQLFVNEQSELILKSNEYRKEKAISFVNEGNISETVALLTQKFDPIQKEATAIAEEWAKVENKLKIRSRIKSLRNLISDTEAIGNYEPIITAIQGYFKEIDTIYEQNSQERLKIVEAARALVERTDWKEATEAFTELADKWKNAPDVKRSVQDEYWNAFSEAKNAFILNKRKHYEELDKEHMVNLDKKLELCDKAEAIAASEEWRSTTDLMNQYMEEWKQVGPVTSASKNDELWERFNNARKAFFERKNQHSNQIREEHVANLAIKTKLVERVEEICNNTEWKATTQEMEELQEKWTATGRVPREQSDVLWNRWRAARDLFYNAKRDYYKSIKEAQEENYKQKKAITERAEKIAKSSDWRNSTDELASLMTEWKAIGYIPKEYGDELWNRFNQARRDFFKRKDADREERKALYEKRKVSRMNQTEQFLYTLKAELKEDKAQLGEFKESVETITGESKKDAELKEHLISLIAKLEKSIPRKEEKIQEVTKQFEELTEKQD